MAVNPSALLLAAMWLLQYLPASLNDFSLQLPVNTKSAAPWLLPARSPLYPELPTLAESFPGFTTTGFLAIPVPKATPRPIQERLNALINEALDSPDIKNRLANEFALTSRPLTLEQCAQQDCDDASDAVWTMGVQAQTDAKGDITSELPTLYLPVDKKVKIKLTSRDVIHSFWVPDFLFKMDVIPGKMNVFELTPNKTGTFIGRCAELCGTYHAQMLFDVKVVSRAEFDQHMADLKAKGQIGTLPSGITTGERESEGKNL